MDKNNSSTQKKLNPMVYLQYDFLFNWKKILEMKKYNIANLNAEIESLPNIQKIEEAYGNYRTTLSTIFLKSILIFGISNLVAWKIKAKPIYIIPKIFLPFSLTCGYTYYDLNRTEKYYDQKYRDEFRVLEENINIRNIIIKENTNYGFNLEEILK